MDEEKKDSQEPKALGRRLKLKRTVSPPIVETPAKIETHAEQALREVEEDDALRGSKGMHFEVDQGCRSCLMVTLFMIIGIFVSIFATWIFLNNR
ncbi:MAG TPA: hypothetical protein VK191_14040 [Symbiobacteriaceae bacterium]|nr:hypothetical protein [Symbiobacteriaceae bacterium]